MNPFWKRLAGLTVADRYQLQQTMSGDDTGALFLASADGEPVVVKLAPENPEQLAAWERVREISHPHLLRLRDCGRTEADGEPFTYAVFERFEQSAADAIEQAPMTPDEVREVLPVVAGALQYLHDIGRVHGAVSPQRVLAVGEEIKLDSDPVREASPRNSPQNDVWDLGATVYELLTRRRIARGEELDLTCVEEPFRSIVEKALTGAASLEWMVEALDAPVEAPAPVVAIEPDPPARVVEEPVIPPPVRAPVQAPVRTPMPRWAYPAAGTILAIGGYVATRGSSHEPQPVPPVAAAVAPVQPLTAPPSVPNAADRMAPVAARPYWRVIAYTYARRDAAQQKADRINERTPEFQASVFAPRGREHGPYLVSLGGPMTRPEALRLQRQARASGLPRDTFVRNYGE